MIGIVGGLISLVSYKYIVQKQGSNLAFLMGYGVIIPLWVSLPYFLVEILDLRNKVMKFAVCAVIPTLGIFKSTEGKTITRIELYRFLEVPSNANKMQQCTDVPQSIPLHPSCPTLCISRRP